MVVSWPERGKSCPVSFIKLKLSGSLIYCAPDEQELEVREKDCKAEPFLHYLTSDVALWLHDWWCIRQTHLTPSLLPDVPGLALD